MDKAAKARQRTHQTRRKNEKRKQRIKEASEAYHYKVPQPQYRSFIPPMGGAELSIAAAGLLFPRILR
jgi:hypothetical protein